MDGEFCIHKGNEFYSMIFTPNGVAAVMEKSSGKEYTAQGEDFQKLYKKLLQQI